MVKQAIVEKLGSVAIKEVPEQKEVEDGYVKIKVHHASLNFADFLQMQGKYQEKPPLPFILGFESSGVVAEIGGEDKEFETSDGKTLKVGDRVVGMFQGAFSEEIVVPQISTFSVPQSYSLSETTSSLTVYGTAYMGLVNRAKVKEGEWVLVTGASGGQGAAAILVAKALKCNVIALARGKQKCDFVKSLGADLVLDLTEGTQPERTKKILKLTGRQGVHVVFECVGGSVFDECLKAVKWGGRILVVGFAGGQIPKVPSNILLVKNASLVGLYWGGHLKNDFETFQESQNELMNLIASGNLKPMPYELFRLENLDQALLKMGSHKVVGKIVIATKYSEHYNKISSSQQIIQPKL